MMYNALMKPSTFTFTAWKGNRVSRTADVTMTSYFYYTSLVLEPIFKHSALYAALKFNLREIFIANALLVCIDYK